MDIVFRNQIILHCILMFLKPHLRHRFLCSDIKQKLERLNSLWNEVQKATSDRGKTLDGTLSVAERFWNQLQAVMQTLKDLQDTLNSQEPPAVEPSAIRQQKEVLKEIKQEIDQVRDVAPKFELFTKIYSEQTLLLLELESLNCKVELFL